MINPELEMRPIARRGLTAEELELKRYATSEFQGSVRCLFSDGVRKRKQRRQEKKIVEDHDQEGLPSNGTAHAQRN